MPDKKPLTDRQLAHRAEMHNRTMSRLQELVAAARSSNFTTGERMTQPPEVQALQRRVRGVTQRWCPIWTTELASVADASTTIALDHVVPVVVLVERVLMGDDLQAVIEQSVLCRLTYAEHRTGGLEVSFRLKQRDLYLKMLDCPIEELGALGWHRYARARITARPLEEWRNPHLGGTLLVARPDC
ncbi:MAG: hypothetical protein RL238_2840 [Actinomycetota bacterium]|jgi:hypothetical protein